MKKLKLNLKEESQILTREQLRQVTGGIGTGDWCLCGSQTECLIIRKPGESRNCTQMCDDAYMRGDCVK